MRRDLEELSYKEAPLLLESRSFSTRSVIQRVCFQPVPAASYDHIHHRSSEWQTSTSSRLLLTLPRVVAIRGSLSLLHAPYGKLDQLSPV